MFRHNGLRMESDFKVTIWQSRIMDTLLLLVLYFAKTLSVTVDDTCTAEKLCSCIRSDGAVDIDCSGSGLKRVPTFSRSDLESVRSIDLSENLIEVIDNRSFRGMASLSRLSVSGNGLQQVSTNIFGKLHNLKYLSLDHNKIERLESYSFQALGNLQVLSLMGNVLQDLNVNSLIGLKSLQNLTLENNGIPLNNSTYPVGLFRDVRSLKFLNVVRNVPYELLKFGSYPGETFKALQSLTELRIDGLYRKQFRPPFRELYNLERLIMTSHGAHCTINQLTKDYFSNLPYLRYIDISYCDIRSAELGPFLGLKYLSYLDISGNQWLTFKSLYNLTYGLNETKIETLKLRNIHCTGGIGTILRNCQMENIFYTNITELHLDQNRIEVFESGLVLRLPRALKTLSIANNKFTFGSYVLEFAELKKLEVLNLSLELVPPDPVDVIIKDCIEKFDIANCPENRHSEVTEEIDTSVLNLSYYFNTGRELIFRIPMAPKLKVVYLNQSRFYFSIGKAYVVNNSVEEVHMQDNFFYEWHGPIYGMHNLKYFDLSNNYCTYMKNGFLSDFKSLRTLKMGRNSLGKAFQNDQHGEIFQNLTNLESLDISKNDIHLLSRKFLKNARNLITLDIHNNYITSFTLEIGHMKKLQHLDLSNNKLLTLKSDTMESLSAVFTNNSSAVSLLQNPLECTCANMEFLTWIEANSLHFQQLSDYRCSQTEKVGFQFSILKESMLRMRKFCTSYEWLIVVNVISITIALTLIIARLIYQNRWKIRYFLYMTKLQYRGQLRFENHDFDFDAFVSYADKDRWFVIHKMLPALERERGLKLLIHNRDFIPGNDISDNILTAIRNSKKTICLLSRHYFQSYWCTFEFNMACMENFNARKGENVVFLVLLENVPTKDLLPKMLELIEEKSYIQVPDDPQVEVVFWENIAKAIDN